MCRSLKVKEKSVLLLWAGIQHQLPREPQHSHGSSKEAGPPAQTYQPLPPRCFGKISFRKGFTNPYFLMQFYTKQISLKSLQIRDCLKLVNCFSMDIIHSYRRGKNNIFQEQSLLEIYHHFVEKYSPHKYMLVKQWEKKELVLTTLRWQDLSEVLPGC